MPLTRLFLNLITFAETSVDKGPVHLRAVNRRLSGESAIAFHREYSLTLLSIEKRETSRLESFGGFIESFS